MYGNEFDRCSSQLAGRASFFGFVPPPARGRGRGRPPRAGSAPTPSPPAPLPRRTSRSRDGPDDDKDYRIPFGPRAGRGPPAWRAPASSPTPSRALSGLPSLRLRLRLRSTSLLSRPSTTSPRPLASRSLAVTLSFAFSARPVSTQAVGAARPHRAIRTPRAVTYILNSKRQVENAAYDVTVMPRNGQVY